MNKKLEKSIRIHKLLTKEIADGNHFDNIGKVGCDKIAKHQILGEHIALVLADFKCEAEGCGKTDITLHHLIGRRNRGIIPRNKFISQRHYFFNIAVLCKEHHNLIDREHPNFPKLVMTKESLDRIRRIYGITVPKEELIC